MGKKIILALIFALFSVEFSNAQIATIHPLDDWMRDPYIVLAPDSNYYLTCTQYIKDSENIKMPVYKSSDLKKWEFLGFKYSLKDASNYNKLKELADNSINPSVKNDGLKLWAPEMHFINNRWVFLHTTNVGFGNFVVTKPGLNFNNNITEWGNAFGKNHDPSLFVDDDGSIWMAAGCTYIRKVKSDLSGFDGPQIDINPSNRKMGHEGTVIKKIFGKYVLFGTAWSTDQMRKGSYNLYYAVADKIEGPYGPRKFAGRFLGHGTPFQDKYGQWWCTAFYNANKPTMRIDDLNAIDAAETAYTINEQGLTIVPLSIKIIKGEIVIIPQDEAYRYPGKEEVQKF